MNNIKKGKRDYVIESLRFIATIGIVVFHYEWLYVGHPIYFQHFYIFVEFFFILSGFFLVQNIKPEKDTVEYIKNTTIKLYIPYVLAFFASTRISCVVVLVIPFSV